MGIVLIVLTCVIAYLAGSVNSSIILSKALSGKDIRESGSGNAGATNMLRTYGKKLAVITLILDVLKGCIGVWIGMLISHLAGIYLTGDSYNNSMHVFPYLKLCGGFFVSLGHNYPVFFKFKGGKGVATSLGVLLALNWIVGLVVFVLTIGIMALTKYVSFGSIMSSLIYLCTDLVRMYIVNDFDIIYIVFDILLGAMLVFRHKENIKRLLSGTENKLGQKKK